MAAWQSFWMNGWAAGAALTKDLADSASSADAIVKAPRKLTADSAAVVDSSGRAPGKQLSDASTPSDTATRGVGLTKTDQATTIDSETAGDLAEIIGKSLGDQVTTADAARFSFTAALESAAAAVEGFTAELAGTETASPASTATVSDALALALAIILADTSTVADFASHTIAGLQLSQAEPSDGSLAAVAEGALASVPAASGGLTLIPRPAHRLGAGTYPGLVYPGRPFPGDASGADANTTTVLSLTPA